MMSVLIRRDDVVVPDHNALDGGELRELGDEAYALYIRCLNELKRRGEW